MAAPIKSAGNSAGNIDERCDFLSDDFDPLTALYRLNVNEVPTPEIAPFSNLNEYSNAVRGLTAEQRRKKNASVSKPGPSVVKPTRQWEKIIKPELLQASGDVQESVSEKMMIKGKKRIQKDIFKGLEALSAGSGPLSTLHNAMKEQRRVKVWIRSAKQLRGFSIGFVVAFDKHWNMAMVDVDETYCQPCLPRTSFTLPKQVLLQMKREQKAQLSTSRPTTPTLSTDTTSPSANAVGSVATIHQTPKSQELTVPAKPRENDPCKSMEPTPSRTGDRTFVVPGSLRAEESSGRRPRFPRGREVKEKVPRLVGRIFVRHLNQVFVRGDNVVMIQLLS